MRYFCTLKPHPVMACRFHIHWLFASILPLASCSIDNGSEETAPGNANCNNTDTAPVTGRLEFPKTRDNGSCLVIVHSTDAHGVNYAVEWDCSRRAQRWTCYQMYASNSVTRWKRDNWHNTTWNGKHWSGDPFQEDPDLPDCCRSTLADYRGSGFNRGHICPSADRLCSQDANGQTFFLSNIQPQYYKFNAGLWEKMEEQIRSWNADTFRDTLYVCKGGTIEDYGTTQGVLTHTPSGLVVPKYFFMAVLCKRGRTYKAMAFWAEHEDLNRQSDRLRKYAVSVRELERKTGIDFFCNLPDAVEERVETMTTASIIDAWGL